jgi:hypothetical protein
MIKNPSEIILSACVLMRYWTCLYAGEEREMIKGETMLRIGHQDSGGEVSGAST